MLAEYTPSQKRRKPSWILIPRSTTWNQGGDSVGQALMEKMGWTSGSGLGANSQGMTKCIRVTPLLENRGLGFKGRPENELPHQDDFTELLQKLSAENGTTPNVAISHSSLEEKSQKSKARVHYHKFTRGKDLSGYSQKDLLCILGTTTSEPRKTGKTMDDYFKSQMLCRSSDDGNMHTTGFVGFSQPGTRDTEADMGNPETVTKKEKKKRKHTHEEEEQAKEHAQIIQPASKKRKRYETAVIKEIKEPGEEMADPESETRKKKKSRKHNKTNEEEVNYAETEVVNSGVEVLDSGSGRKKKRKHYTTDGKVLNQLKTEVTNPEVEIYNPEIKTKKSKKSKTGEVVEFSAADVVDTNSEVRKKKKKRKHNRTDEIEVREHETVLILPESETRKKKKQKHNKTNEVEQLQDFAADPPYLKAEEVDPESEIKTEDKKRKKSSKRKSVTFSTELFEVMVIPARDDYANELSPSEDSTDIGERPTRNVEVSKDHKKEREEGTIGKKEPEINIALDKKKTPVGVEKEQKTIEHMKDTDKVQLNSAFQRETYINGLLVNNIIRRSTTIVFRKGRRKRIHPEHQESAFDFFPGATINITGYVGLNY